MFGIGNRAWRQWMFLSAVIAVIRLAAFAFLEYRKSTGTQSILHLPLVLILYPEIWLFASYLSRITALVFGSSALSAFVVALGRLLGKGTE